MQATYIFYVLKRCLIKPFTTETLCVSKGKGTTSEKFYMLKVFGIDVINL